MEQSNTHYQESGFSSVKICVEIASDNVEYTDDHILSAYSYQDTRARIVDDSAEPPRKRVIVEPVTTDYQFRLKRKVPRLGLMLVGWGGNNGSTLTACLLAHRSRLQWRIRTGVQTPNYFGSLVMASTLRMGKDAAGKDVYVPFHSVLPIADPADLVIGGWDISSLSLGAAMERACVLEPDLQRQLRKELDKLKPLPSIYDPDFIAVNQADRADHLIPGTRAEQLSVLRGHIRNFKAAHSLDKVIIVWTANTERYVDILPSVNDSADALLGSIQSGHPEVSPSTIFAVAAILEKCPFINGSPQNTFVPGLVDLAIRERVPIGGDDFKSGQTKLKSVLVDFLVGAGIKPLSITSYNHLGNNDGRNLSAPSQFRSKEISKSNVVDDMVSSNAILYNANTGRHPDHVVVIKYVPAVGDSKRALDEYESEIFMGGRNTISIHNTCEDSLLATPLILDLTLLTDLLSRIEIKRPSEAEYAPLHPVLSHLSYFLKAPLVPPGAPVINALFKQRPALGNLFRAVLGLPPQLEMELEMRLLHAQVSSATMDLLKYLYSYRSSRREQCQVLHIDGVDQIFPGLLVRGHLE